MFAAGGYVEVGGTAAGLAHVSGVKRCGSPWACPVCAPVVRERRAVELDSAAAAWIAQGGSVWFVTATLRHKLGDDLAELLGMVQGAWSRTFRFKSRPGWYGGQVRAVEITHGDNGWHPHVHAAVFVSADTYNGAGELRALGTAWAESVRLLGGDTDVASEASPGWDVRPVSSTDGLSEYLCKVSGGWGVGLELARADVKSGRGKGRTPAQLLELAQAGDHHAAELFLQYERITAGRRAIVASRGLLASLGVDEISDEEAAEAEVTGEVVVRAVIEAGVWRSLLRTGLVGMLLGDVARFAADRSTGWAWPSEWLSTA